MEERKMAKKKSARQSLNRHHSYRVACLVFKVKEHCLCPTAQLSNRLSHPPIYPAIY